MESFGQKVIRFHQQLVYTGKKLPEGIRIMNPFRESLKAPAILEAFAAKFLHTGDQRHILLGINPGRFGGGITGIPFTDPKRLKEVCGIPYDGPMAHEPSSVFIYDMIAAYGGPIDFYNRFYINSPCPLGFVQEKDNGKEVNYNYYDSAALTAAARPFMISSLRNLIALGIFTDTAICLGTGKNVKFLQGLNDEFGFFQKIIALEHPRYIMQYKSREKHYYIDKYLTALQSM
ncbi:uracil-DNA glycosylase family protein [Flavihumibacter petaseus]|uniref:Uracil-DNA glycosylase-like domain-containing protein n=1 Tax=Flavihumibacter petaseus NBRC 106054 TaxID=1220578 RepID=A0A0E9N501_9BACT|nr:uracil-DNA glycosylase family protein [Flavihumibacter petaseus]GAO44894.1 hypothetical protein FPE01S_04_01370 [Flavihumibacter petaseus NBRC 106054]